MSEWQLSYDPAASYRSGPPSGSSQVEWYQTGGTDFSASSADYTYDAMGGTSTSATYGSFEDEAPLLEELGIDLQGILRRSVAVLTHRLGSNVLLDLDLGGPLFFAAILGSVHLLTGKLHFGVILGWSVVGSAAVWFVVSNLAGQGGHASGHELGPPGIYDCCCLLGYGLLPMLLHALISLLVPKGTATVALAVVALLWSGMTAAKLFTKRSPVLEDHLYLIAYPCFLMYSAFALLSIY
ncbi:hypothetical protein WJX75_008673 [Coccomyxa subellipsoidea]|uniref:Protein YIP n=1 Tax=Coccomyxa subellipsoidea TaxID=248742 RepID=A0ABR2Z4X5_9CHLO